MKLKNLVASTCAAAAILASAASAATYTFVGSWQVDDGDSWTTVPEAYTGQEAAAFLFGGSASDYVISTISADEADIDFMSWISTWGGACSGVYPCGTKVAQDFEISTGGLYAEAGDTSALVRDWAAGSEFTNYAFLVAPIPVPASMPLLAAGIGGLVIAKRRKKSA